LFLAQNQYLGCPKFNAKELEELQLGHFGFCLKNHQATSRFKIEPLKKFKP
jgi:hypothetical protein